MKFQTEAVMFRKFFAVILYAILCSFAACGKMIPATEPQSKIIAKDKVVLIGKFIPPENPQKLTFILLHGLASGKGEWYGFADKLAGLGYGCLAVDMRGHGESCKNADGSALDVKYFGWPGPGSEWSMMTEDVDAMVKYLVSKRGINKNRIAVAGASVGANIALIYAAGHKSVPLVILLSPGLDYAGFLTAPAMKEYGGRPVLLAASPGDSYAYGSSMRLMEIAKENGSPAVFLEGSNARHGVQMFDGKFEDGILKWIDSHN